MVGTTLTIGSSLGAAYGLRLLFKKFTNFGHHFDGRAGSVLYGLFFAGGTTAAYYYYSDRYLNDICYPFIDKYLETAKKNGFEDYEISKFKANNGEQKYLSWISINFFAER